MRMKAISLFPERAFSSCPTRLPTTINIIEISGRMCYPIGNQVAFFIGGFPFFLSISAEERVFRKGRAACSNL